MRKRSSYLLLLLVSGLLMATSCGSDKPEQEEPAVEKRTEDDFPEIKALTERIDENPGNAELYFTRGDA